MCAGCGVVPCKCEALVSNDVWLLYGNTGVGRSRVHHVSSVVTVISDGGDVLRSGAMCTLLADSCYRTEVL